MPREPVAGRFSQAKDVVRATRIAAVKPDRGNRQAQIAHRPEIGQDPSYLSPRGGRTSCAKQVSLAKGGLAGNLADAPPGQDKAHVVPGIEHA